MVLTQPVAKSMLFLHAGKVRSSYLLAMETKWKIHDTFRILGAPNIIIYGPYIEVPNIVLYGPYIVLQVEIPNPFR